MNITLELKTLISKSNKIEVRIIELLQMVEEQKLYLERYASLFDYCRKELGLSDSQSQRRVEAVRAVRKNPKLKLQVQEGNITVTQASLLGSLQSQAQNLGTDTRPIMEELVRDCQHKTVLETEEIARERFSLPGKKKKVLVEMDDQLFEKWRRLKSIKNYRNNDQIIGELIDQELLRYEARSSNIRKTVQVSRVPTPALRQLVLKRDGFTCRACSSQVNLQIDHVVPYAKGGKTSFDNLRVLCRSHNLARIIR